MEHLGTANGGGGAGVQEIMIIRQFCKAASATGGSGIVIIRYKFQ
jgi:hypothetical protein